MERPALTDLAHASQPGRATILIVDGEVETCDACAQALRAQQYEVCTATEIEAALELLHQRRFDLLLCEICLPGAGGVALAWQARLLDPLLAVVLMARDPSPQLLIAAAQHGLSSYLSKPIASTELLQVVAQSLRLRATGQDQLRLELLRQTQGAMQALSLPRSPEAICEAIVQAACQELGCRCGAALLTNQEPAPHLLHFGDHDPALSQQGWGLLNQAIGAAAPLQHLGACCGADEAVRNVGLPLVAYGETVGALLLAGIPAETPLDSRLELLSLLAAQAAAALRHSQLYDALHIALQRQQDIDRLKSEFISIASHELRTPLAIVLGYTTMLLREPLTERQRESLQRVVESALRISDVVDDMINLRHLETGEAQLSLSLCSLQQLLGESIEAIQPLAQAKEQQLELQYLGQEDCQVFLDREKIALVLGNLLSNAIKFTPRGGSITVRGWCGALVPGQPLPPGLEVDLQPGRWAYVSVKDTGVGIAPEHQRRIFERFYQIASSLTRQHSGTGLGLAIVRGLIELHGGSVRVSSQPGQGSTFTFVLPQRVAHEELGA